MLTPTNVIPSTNAKGIFNTTTSIKTTPFQWTSGPSNNQGFIAQPMPLSVMNVVFPDPRAMDSFEDKAKALKDKVESVFRLAMECLPIPLRSTLMKNCILSGSCISSIYHGEEPKDFDLWCRDASMIPILKEEIPQKYNDSIMEYNQSYEELKSNSNFTAKKLITDNAITLKGKVQLITLGTYTEQRKMFDFTHCMPYYDCDAKTLYISPRQMQLIGMKKLEQNPGGRAPVDWRIQKFKMRGWSF